MSQHLAPSEIVDRQLRAYNARDIDRYCSLFADDAVVSRTGTVDRELARGSAAIRAYYSERFRSSGLACSVKARMVLGRFVVDHELVTGIGPDVLEVVAIYEVRESLIRSVRILWAD